METTIEDTLKKVQEIDHAILLITSVFPGQERFGNVINLLAEYRDKILDSKVDI